jgi:hypothetical protein
VSRRSSATRERGCSYSETNGLKLGHYEPLRFLKYSHEVLNMQEEKRKISNKINGLYCWYKLHRISSNVLGALLLLDFSADFFRLRRGVGKPEKGSDLPIFPLIPVINHGQ